MTGFRAFLAKEWMETRRTWRIWVLPGLLLFFALVGPLLAELTPQLVASLATDQPGTVIILPDPTWRDAYRQFFSSLTQIVLIALVIVTADAVAGERRAGTAVLVLTKPVSRRAFILAKVVAQAALLATATVVAAAVCWAGTMVFFGTAPLGALARATGGYLLLALVMITAVILLSVELRAQAGVAGAGIAVYAGLVLAGQWGPLREWTPAGLFDAIERAIAGDAFPVWPAATALVAAAALLVLAALRFERAELTGGG